MEPKSECETLEKQGQISVHVTQVSCRHYYPTQQQKILVVVICHGSGEEAPFSQKYRPNLTNALAIENTLLQRHVSKKTRLDQGFYCPKRKGPEDGEVRTEPEGRLHTGCVAEQTQLSKTAHLASTLNPPNKLESSSSDPQVQTVLR